MNTVDFYLRLSLEDGAQQDESNSITSQRQILKDYIRSKKNLQVFRLGNTLMTVIPEQTLIAPHFKKMIALVKKNEVNTILVQDLSRFARDYIESGAYIEQIFPLCKFVLFR